jgi:hypothetical protein
MKFRVESVPQPSTYKAIYRFKAWPDSQAEPGAWDLVHSAIEGSNAGSIALVSHFAEATFGNVSIVPLAVP